MDKSIWNDRRHRAIHTKNVTVQVIEEVGS
jgi:hypothetical protein